MLDKNMQCGEGYLAGDSGTAEHLFSNFVREGYRGIYIFKGSPHFFIRKGLSVSVEDHPLDEVARTVAQMLKEKRSVILLDGNELYENNRHEALRFICCLKDWALVNGSCIIVFIKDLGNVQKGFLEREHMRVV